MASLNTSLIFFFYFQRPCWIWVVLKGHRKGGTGDGTGGGTATLASWWNWVWPLTCRPGLGYSCSAVGAEGWGWRGLDWWVEKDEKMRGGGGWIDFLWDDSSSQAGTKAAPPLPLPAQPPLTAHHSPSANGSSRCHVLRGVFNRPLPSSPTVAKSFKG